MIQYHPPEDWLIEYAAGSLTSPFGVAVSGHVAMCPECQAKVDYYQRIAGALLEQTEQAKVEEEAFEQLWSRIKDQEQTTLSNTEANAAAAVQASSVATEATSKRTKNKSAEQPQPAEANPDMPKMIVQSVDYSASIPKPLRRYASQALTWKKTSRAMRTAQVAMGSKRYESNFYCIQPGGKILRHTHSSLEATLVLCGSFSDENDTYHEGDFLLNDHSYEHTPWVKDSKACLCFAVVDAPIRLTGPFGRLLNPFIR